MSTSRSAVLERPTPVDDDAGWFDLETQDESVDQLTLSSGVTVPWLFEVIANADQYRVSHKVGFRTEPVVDDAAVLRFLGDERSERARPRRSGFKPRG
jgi:hypothetical protein